MCPFMRKNPSKEVFPMENKRFYITTPIYYPSDKLHIGHTYCATSV